MNAICRRPPEIFSRIVSDSVTEPFWTAANQNRLTCAQCANCGLFRMPPTPFCPNCRSQMIDWPTLPGTGTIYSYTTVYRSAVPGTEDNLPYVVAVVALDGAEPARLITNIVDEDLDSIRIGEKVKVTFDEVSDRQKIPRFKIVEKQQ